MLAIVARGSEGVDRGGPYLFVSHTSLDGDAALLIVGEMERRGHRCWVAPRDVRPGRPYDDEIAEAIESCAAVLLVFSGHCNESPYIRREVTVAGEANKLIMPFRIENAQPQKGLRVRLADLHWIDGFIDRERALEELARAAQNSGVSANLQPAPKADAVAPVASPLVGPVQDLAAAFSNVVPPVVTAPPGEVPQGISAEDHSAADARLVPAAQPTQPDLHQSSEHSSKPEHPASLPSKEQGTDLSPPGVLASQESARPWRAGNMVLIVSAGLVLGVLGNLLYRYFPPFSKPPVSKLVVATTPAVHPRVLPVVPAVHSNPTPVISPAGAPANFACAGQTGKVIFEDNFANNSGGWDVDPHETYVKGALQIKADAKAYFDTSLNLTFNATEGDYCTEIAFPSEAAEAGNPDDVGIVFLAKDYQNKYAFVINSNGDGWVNRHVKGTTNAVVPATKFPAIKTAPGSVNALRVVVKDQKLTFYVNGEQVKVLRAQIGESANRFGFYAGTENKPPQKDRLFSVKSFKLTQPQLVPAVQSNPTPVVKPAGPPSAFACAGQTGKVIFEDNFADDSGGWNVGANANYVKGAFQIKADAKADFGSSLNTTFNATEGDYCVEIAFPSEAAEAGNHDDVGIDFLAADDDNEYSFNVGSDGNAWIVRLVKGASSFVMPATKVPAVKTAPGSVNALRVVVKDGKLTFYVNGEQVKVLRAQMDKSANRFGFWAGTDNKPPQKERLFLVKSFKLTQPQLVPAVQSNPTPVVKPAGAPRQQSSGAELAAQGEKYEAKRDYAGALKYFQSAADQGNARGQDDLGHLYDNGQGVPQNYKEAAKYYQLAADQGDADAQTNLGYLYNHGKGVPQDHAAALKYYQLAAAQGFGQGQNNLGSLYENGQGVPPDYKKAVKYYQLAADQGNAQGQNNLATMYENGHGVPQDYKKAAKYFQLAADHNYASAQANLGYLYEYGKGVPQDYKRAAKYYQLAANQGNAEAQTNLGYLYNHGQGVPQDHAAALKYYKLAAEQGYTQGQNNLGSMYETGQGVAQDYKEAAKYYRLAADQGNAQAQNNLASLYAAGKGVPQDDVEAAKYYKLAADHGYSFAQEALAALYERGRGVQKNYEMALKYYKLAAVQGDAEAKVKLKNLLANPW